MASRVVLLASLLLVAAYAQQASAQVPSSPSNVGAVVEGFSVTLTWRAPSSGVANSYVIEVGSRSGASDLAVFDTATNLTSFTAIAPAGTFFVRVRARSAAGLGNPSPQVSFTTPSTQTCIAAPNSFGGWPRYSVSGNVLTFTWSHIAGASGRTPTSYVIEAGSFVGGANLAQLVVPSTGQTSQSFSVVAPLGAYWVRMKGANACGVGLPGADIFVTLGEGTSSLSGRWTGITIIACPSDPLCRLTGEVPWSLELDIRQTGSSVTGWYYFRSQEVPTTAQESWGIVSGTVGAGRNVSLVLTARGPSPMSPNPGGTFSGTLSADFQSLSGTLFPLPAANIPAHTPTIQLRRK